MAPPPLRPGNESSIARAPDWLSTLDLAGIRDEAPLARLPEDERKACKALWAEVDRLLRKAPASNGH